MGDITWEQLVVVGKSSNDRGGVSGHLGFAVDADDDGCLGGGNGNAVSALSNRSCVDVVVGPGQDVALASDVKALAIRLVDGGLVSGDDVGHDLHLGGGDL
ncbi:hypothetical protein Trco_003986 [Trichoderma cornu-damae]|uniref:Uncharacterized protein n=1 Tax=Trichoderma cornu-damae TaxID=654480 RepID=A0A9P8TWP3_9HYPO|nr:hypothetical protein Trco_003986 [Trichoderma cornu-damae]